MPETPDITFLKKFKNCHFGFQQKEKRLSVILPVIGSTLIYS